ncbi:galactoside alpha-(1,2)-fucosyltransferase 2-like [Schistocerca cancellata]|uniref:galactoside alpha-(1,2)-fucosyltransferase 2-like n=1 Tax=Schistocerca cancellata TaxID=274614 RepID=UPI002117949C|nr:galactoside alpha-(1,2)-fucosyltransferase 2-like [Schistocerca cancellata]
MRTSPRAMVSRQALLATVASAALLVYICAYYVSDTPPLPGHRLPRDVVFWQDDEAAAREPYVYRFSSYNDHFPGVALAEVSVQCLPRGAATVRSGGRLGNLIMEFASLWTAARLYNLTAFVPAQLRGRLRQVFEPLGVPETYEFLSQSGCPEDTMEEVDQRVFKVDLERRPLPEVVARAKELHLPIVFEICIILPETIVPLAAEVRRHFRYQPRLRKYADNKLRSLRRSVVKANPDVKEVVFAGVHVRRTDYADQLQLLYNTDQQADERYYGRAALWLQSTVVPPGGELVLVVASDDPDWVQDVLLPHLRGLGLRHSFLAGDGMLEEPERDLVLLSACNHSIFAYGTFGLWSALMTGGRAAVYHLNEGDAVSPAMQFAQHIPGWVAISQ